MNGVRMAFTITCGRDLYKLSLLKRFDIRRPDITHSSSEASCHLMNDLTQMSLEGHPALYTFRNQFQIIFYILEIAVFGTLCHGTKTAHSTIRLILSGFINDRFTRTFINP